jgi:hypothetical protein
MNIKQAGIQIANTVRAYLEKDEYGRCLIPQHKQRPVCLMGPPGIGKTEIMSQVASQLGIGLLSYSMTHHTRQSALGLPVIKQKVYDGVSYDISEYTMSEIIAAVYDLMERSGVRNGILFLDEVNCISETLTPVMLQFLQYKVFGGHRLPEGWVVVTAGNPPEYNSSVREFDIVTWDRLKRIDVEPDIKVWKEYARASDLHGAVVTYLDIKPQNFYLIESTPKGKSFVTARGWDDLSRMLNVCEKLGISADKELIGQYIRHERIAEDFAVYLELYEKYRSDYRISAILDGENDSAILGRAKAAKFDERYSLLGLMLDTVSREAGEVNTEDTDLMAARSVLLPLKDSDDISSDIRGHIALLEDQLSDLRAAGSLSESNEVSILFRIGVLKKCLSASEDGYEGVKRCFGEYSAGFDSKRRETVRHMDNMFRFCEAAFGEGQELLVLVTELAANPVTARFITCYGCEEYYRHDKSLMFYERRLEILHELEGLE